MTAWFYEVWLRGPGGMPWACVHGVAYSKAEAERLARDRYKDWPEPLEAEVRQLHEVVFMPPAATVESSPEK